MICVPFVPFQERHATDVNNYLQATAKSKRRAEEELVGDSGKVLKRWINSQISTTKPAALFRENTQRYLFGGRARVDDLHDGS